MMEKNSNISKLVLDNRETNEEEDEEEEEENNDKNDDDDSDSDLTKIDSTMPEIDILKEEEFDEDKFPASYKGNGPCEQKLLSIIDNFCRQHYNLYKDRKMLFITPKNEFGVRKFVSSTLHPTEMPHTQLSDFEGLSTFVADYLNYIPLTPPHELPHHLYSPSTTLALQRGTCFEYSSLLASLLIGVGYDAYVVSGYATRGVCLVDQSQDDCPLLKEEIEVETPPTPLPFNKYSNNPMLLMKDILDNKLEEDESEVVRASSARETFKPSEFTAKDVLYGLRVHSWVLVLKGKRQVKEPFFIEPTTGLTHAIDSDNYLGIENIWNSRNVWVCMQECTSGVKKLVYSLKITSLWEFVLYRRIKKFKTPKNSTSSKTSLPQLQPVGQEDEGGADSSDSSSSGGGDGEDDGAVIDTMEGDQLYDDNSQFYQTHIQLPASWSKAIHLTSSDLRQQCPGSKKVLLYKKSKVEKFAVYNQKDGLVLRVTEFEDLERTLIVRIKETYQHRLDKLSQRIYNYVDERVSEFYKPGKQNKLKEHHYKLKPTDDKKKREDLFQRKTSQKISSINPEFNEHVVEVVKSGEGGDGVGESSASDGGSKTRGKSKVVGEGDASRFDRLMESEESKEGAVNDNNNVVSEANNAEGLGGEGQNNLNGKDEKDNLKEEDDAGNENGNAVSAMVRSARFMNYHSSRFSSKLSSKAKNSVYETVHRDSQSILRETLNKSNKKKSTPLMDGSQYLQVYKSIMTIQSLPTHSVSCHSLSSSVSAAARASAEVVRESVFYSSYRPDSLLRRIETKSFMEEHFDERDDLLSYKLVEYAKGVQDSLTISNTRTIDKILVKYRRNEAEAPMLVEQTPKDSAKVSQNESEDDARADDYYYPEAEYNYYCSPQDHNTIDNNPEISEITFNILTNRITVVYHREANRITATVREFTKPNVSEDKSKATLWHPDTNYTVYLSNPIKRDKKKVTLYQLMLHLMRLEEKYESTSRDSEIEVQTILEERLVEEEKIVLEHSMFHAVQDKARKRKDNLEQIAREEQGEKDKEELDLISMVLSKEGSPENLTPEKIEALKHDCRREMERRCVVRINLIQDRYDKESSELQKRQQRFQQKQMSMTKRDEEVYTQYCTQAMFTIQMLEMRINRHVQLDPLKKKEFEEKLRTDPRLNVPPPNPYSLSGVEAIKQRRI